jgi:hypothetical protein
MWAVLPAEALIVSRLCAAFPAEALLVVSATSLALAVPETVLRTWPTLLPFGARALLPGGTLSTSAFVLEDPPIRVGFRYAPLSRTKIRFDPSDPSLLGPRYEALARRGGPREPVTFEFRTDEMGFPNSPPVLGRRYRVIVCGDSFCVPNGPMNWVEQLGQKMGSPVLNLSVASWGTQAEVAAVETFGAAALPELVLLAFFEGNDLLDVATYADHRTRGTSWKTAIDAAGPLQRLLTPRLLQYAFLRIFDFARGVEDDESKPIYPLKANLGGRIVDLCFYPLYVGMLGVPADELVRSVNLDLVRGSLQRLRTASQRSAARTALVFIPSKEHVYFRLLLGTPARLAQAVAHAEKVGLGTDSRLSFSEQPVSMAAVARNIDAQRDTMRQLAESSGLAFVDLTEAFVRRAADSTELYYYSDTHWNQTGHALAADLVYDSMGQSGSRP